MYESRIAADHLTVSAIAGYPPEIDALAACNLSGHTFLRAAWYAGGAPQAARTLLIRRGAAGSEGALIAAIPTAAFGPAIAGARKVPGAYWPLRSPLIAPGCNTVELAQALQHPAARSLGPVWRVGPAKMDDPAIKLLIEAAQLANWAVLSRPAGTSWVIDLDAARNEGWPRASTAKRMGRLERRLDKLGQVNWQLVRGRGWNEAILADLGAVETASWIAAQTDGSGAKFMTARQRRMWQQKLSDPVLAEMLCATILRIDGRAVAFSFDLDDGPVQYGIAGTYITELGKHEIGKLANYRAMVDAIADGQSVMDMGAGDSGYKRTMGAVEGYALADLLFVRRRMAARLLENIWGHALPLAEPLAAPAGARRNG